MELKFANSIRVSIHLVKHPLDILKDCDTTKNLQTFFLILFHEITLFEKVFCGMTSQSFSVNPLNHFKLYQILKRFSNRHEGKLVLQNEYKRGISGWNFNLDDMKAQASLIQDDDIPEKDEDIQGKQLQHQLSSSKQFRQLQYQLSSASQYSDIADLDDNGHSASFSSVDSTANIAKCEKSDGDVSISGSTREQQTSNIISPGKENRVENNLADKSETALNGKSSDGAAIYSHQSDKLQNQPQNFSSCNGAFIPQTVDDALPELISKGSRTSATGEELEEKAKPVVQQKGRFKITSENVEAVGAPMLQKSHSMQVISQHPAISSPLPSDSRPSSSVGHAYFPTLQSALQTNILQRDSILSLMKQVSVSVSPGF